MSTRSPRPPKRVRRHAPFDVGELYAGSVAGLVVEGELDMASSPRLGIAITEVLRSNPEALVIDICNVDFVDSTGLGVMLEARRRCARQGAELRIACDVPNTLRLLRLTRLDRDFAIYTTRDDALAN